MNDIFKTLTQLKQNFIPDGVEIVGVFGSFARGEQTTTSDIDIAYKLSKNTFFQKYKGFKSVSKLAEIKNELSQQLQRKVDFISIENSNSELVKNIKNEIKYV
ncbi:MAG: nucleotidyltransferase domain-containing protein [Campylobacterota bacterium]|nr:nucleotidyltransferase domain-containing protein [Campylobacterota bacterium]